VNGVPWYHDCCWWWGFLVCVGIPGMLLLGIHIGRGIGPRNKRAGNRVAWVGADGVRRVGTNFGGGVVCLDDGTTVRVADGTALIPVDDEAR